MGRTAKKQTIESSTQPTQDELYRALFEQAADGIFIADTQGRFVEVNRQACEILGYTREELLNLSWQDLIPIEDQARDPLRLDELRAGKIALNERRLRCKGGRLLAVEIKGRMLSTGHLLAFVRDSSERKRAEEHRQEAERTRSHLAAIVESSNDAIIAKDLNGAVTSWNAGAQRIYGYTADEMLGQPIMRLVPPERVAEEEQILHKIKQDERVPHFETQRIGKDGRLIDVSIAVSPIKDAMGEVVGASKVVRDITERKRAEKAVRESEEQYRLLFDQMLSAFALHEIISDEAGIPTDYRFITVNAAFEEMTGLQAKDIIGKTVRQVLPDIEPYWIERYGQVALTGVSTQFEDYSSDLKKYYEVRAYCPKRGQFAVIFHDITQRRRAETEMQELAKFPDENPNPVLRVAKDGVLLYANRASAGLLESWDCAVGRQVPAGWRKLILATLDSDLSGEVEVAWGERIFSLALAPVVDGGYVNIYGYDITERKWAEEKLRAEEERFRLAAESLSDVVYEWDLGSNVQWFGNIDELLGYATGEFPRTLEAWLDILHAEDRERVWSAVQRQLRGEAAYDIEYRVRHRDGDWRHWLARGQVLRDTSGQPYRWIGAVTDITEQKRAEEDLRQSRERERFLADIVEKADQPFAVGYPDGRLGVCNRAFCELTGYSAQELRELDWDAVLTPPEWIESEMKALAELDRTGRPVRYQKEYIRKDGRRVPIELLVHAARDEAGRVQHYYAFVTDITERKRAEEQIRQLNAELEGRVVERTAQLEAANQELEAFAYSVSHDLRAPLRAIDGYTRILQEDYEPFLDAEGQRVCGVVRDEARRMGQLIDDLLDFSRLGRTQMQAAAIDMERLAAAVFDELTAPEDMERLEFHMGSLPPALGDLTLIRQAWLNLLSNAVKFSSKREQAVVEVGGRQDGGENVYWVRDNGAGFDRQYADKLFGVFQRLHSEREFDGTGVGLAIVRRVIRRHGGRVWAESEVNQGATFYFTLPRKGD
jgi:PAS domain S-box-containing protein